MPTDHERFWDHERIAFVGHSAKKGFPSLSFHERRAQGKPAFAIDPSLDEIEGQKVWPDFASLPQPVDAAVLEVPKEETREWVERAAHAGIKHLWIHMGRETPEALALAEERGIEVLTGTCAVMYLKPGFSYHTLHKWVNQLAGRY